MRFLRCRAWDLRSTARSRATTGARRFMWKAARIPAQRTHQGSSWDRVNPQFFETVGQPVIRGRGLTDGDTATSQKVAVVNQEFVKKFFPNEDPIGRHFGVFQQKYSGAFEIVGIVADAKYSNPRDKLRPMYFRPLNQQLVVTGDDPNELMAEGNSLYINSITLRFKSSRRTWTEWCAAFSTTSIRTSPSSTCVRWTIRLASNLGQERLMARLTMLFGLLALVLASVGLYGITSYAVARRTNEIGLRMALGADRGNVLRLIMRGAFSQVFIGLAIGIPIALLGARLVSDQLFKVSFYDPLSIAIAVGVLSLAAAVAGLIPATRAASIEPMQALRTE